MRATIAISLSGKRVLDVGCGNGSAFALPDYAGAHLHGVDINPQVLAAAALAFPQATYVHAAAEDLPYADEAFDAVVSRVALPYTDIPRALVEIHRVLKPGGDFWATVHSWRFAWDEFKAAVRSMAWLRTIDNFYLLGATASYVTLGKIPARPWSGSRETFQTERSLSRDLRRAGFIGGTFAHEGGNLIVQALRPLRLEAPDAAHAVAS